MTTLETAFFFYLMLNALSGFYYAGKGGLSRTFTAREMGALSCIYFAIAMYLVIT